jgi:hypothetical protein
MFLLILKFVPADNRCGGVCAALSIVDRRRSGELLSSWVSVVSITDPGKCGPPGAIDDCKRNVL